MQNKIYRIIVVFIATTFLNISLYSYNHPAINYPIKKIELNKSNSLLEQLRIGVGTGVAFYVGDQRSFTQYTVKFGEFTEFRSSYVAEIFWQKNSRFEFGLRFIDGKSEVLKSKNTLGVQNKFNDIQINAQYSFNDNIALNRKRFTINGQLGIGLIRFQSRFFSINPITKKEISVVSAVGYGSDYIAQKKIDEKQNTFIGNAGINIGMRVLPYISLYWQNSLNLAPTYYLSGNLYKWSWLPPDGYFYSGILLSVNLGQPNLVNSVSRKKYKCPKF